MSDELAADGIGPESFARYSASAIHCHRETVIEFAKELERRSLSLAKHLNSPQVGDTYIATSAQELYDRPRTRRKTVWMSFSTLFYGASVTGLVTYWVTEPKPVALGVIALIAFLAATIFGAMALNVH